MRLELHSVYDLGYVGDQKVLYFFSISASQTQIKELRLINTLGLEKLGHFIWRYYIWR